MMTLEKAQPNEAEALTSISRRAFESDVLWGASGPGGPPGYDSAEWQAKAIEFAHYFKIVFNGQIVGGVIVFPKGEGHYELARIFIDPAFHRQGFGRQAMRLVEEAFPDATRWTLDTPRWNTRTPSFYQSLGYTLIGQDGGLLLFEKRLSHPKECGQ